MKAKYILIPLVLLLVLVVLQLIATFSGLDTNEVNTSTPRDITYSYKDKKPYGGYVAYHWITKLWDDKQPSVITRSFASAYNKNASMKDGGNVYILLANHNFTSPSDLRAMKSFVEDGNTLVLGLCAPDSALGATFGFTTYDDNHPRIHHTTDRDTTAVFLNPGMEQRVFKGNGFHNANTFTGMDSVVSTILATDDEGRPTFITIAQGRGRVLVLLDPVALTNYPLLDKQHRHYLENVLSYVPNYQTNNAVYWDEFYKYQTAPRTDSDDDNGLFMLMRRYPAIRWAVWLSLLTALFYILFESKRRQRIIPEIPPVTNASVEFVTTIGKLYFEHHNNSNLSQKMAQHLLEYIRNRYNLNTQVLDEEFTTTLTRKSGQQPDAVRQLVQLTVQARNNQLGSDADLHLYYNATHQFYQNS